MNNFEKSQADKISKSFYSEEEIGATSLDNLEKGGKKAYVGEIRTFGGRDYIRTNDGWKFHGKGTGKKAQEHATNAGQKVEVKEELKVEETPSSNVTDPIEAVQPEADPRNGETFKIVGGKYNVLVGSKILINRKLIEIKKRDYIIYLRERREYVWRLKSTDPDRVFFVDQYAKDRSVDVKTMPLSNAFVGKLNANLLEAKEVKFTNGGTGTRSFFQEESAVAPKEMHKGNSVEKLALRLEESTKELKHQYIEETKEWSASYFDKISAMTQRQIINQKGYDIRNSKFTSAQALANVDPKDPSTYMRDSKSSASAWAVIVRIRSNGKENFIAENVKNAEDHFKSSVGKLAFRIVEKGLIADKVELSSSRVRTNFETIATDGYQTVRAWTIIARGPIKAPHYRYLIR